MVDLIFSDNRLAALYDLLASWGEADDRFYLPLVMSAASVLDVGCGTGQLLISAREAGHTGRLCGLDPAQAMLDIARARTGIEWRLGDLTTVAFDNEFDLIVLTGHTFQVFLTDDDLHAALSAMKSALTAGGQRVFETRNPAACAWEQWTPENVFEFTTPDGATARFSRQAEPPRGDLVRFTSTFTSSAWDRPLYSHSTLRFLDSEALAAHLTAAGLTVDAQYGDWDRSPVTVTSPEIIIFARRA